MIQEKQGWQALSHFPKNASKNGQRIEKRIDHISENHRQSPEGRTEMDLLTYYPDLAVAYPEYITQKQFCEVCGICHKTAYNLTRRGEISYEIVDTPTGRIHHIKLTDALAYLYKKDTLYGNDENVNRQIYEVLQAHFSYLPDLLRTQQIRELTGFSMTAIQRWVLEKRITAILGRKGWNITRDSLVTFLSSSYCLRGNRKPQKFQALLQKCTEQLKI